MTPNAAAVEGVEPCMLVMRASEYRTAEDRLVLDGKEYTATQLREALANRAQNVRLREALRLVPTHVVLDLSEIPGRDSPDDQPHMLLVTGDEIAATVAKWINAAIEGTP